jgi:HK97 family phage prohead protease
MQQKHKIVPTTKKRTIKMTREKRFIEVEDIEIRSTHVEGGTEQKFVSGIGIVYNREVEIWPGYMEKIRNGALRTSVDSGKEIKSFFNHNPSSVLSTTRSNPPLVIEDTDKGLRFESPIPPTTYGNDLEVNLQRKNVRGASFSFEVKENGDILTRDENGIYHREIIDAELYEVGPVTNPAYPSTNVGLRSQEEAFAEAEERCKQENIPPVVADDTIKIKRMKLTILEGALNA